MLRSAREVISELLAEKMRIVTKFPAGVRDTGNRIEDLIPGTAVFAGGSGLWRGPHCFGPLPDFFPESPVLILGHNFDSEAGYQSSRQRGGELQSSHTFWGVLLAYLKQVDIRPNQCFFTNALMGLKPGKATGKMPTTPEFELQCLQFLQRQIQIVRPRFILALGGEASKRLAKIHPPMPWHQSMHPSAREFKPLVTREDRIVAQGVAIASFLRRVGAAG